MLEMKLSDGHLPAYFLRLLTQNISGNKPQGNLSTLYTSCKQPRHYYL